MSFLISCYLNSVLLSGKLSLRELTDLCYILDNIKIDFCTRILCVVMKAEMHTPTCNPPGQNNFDISVFSLHFVFIK